MAYLISRNPYNDRSEITGNPDAKKFFDRTDNWLAAVEAAGVRDVESAQELALAAYQAGDMDAAQRWINRAGDSPGGAMVAGEAVFARRENSRGGEFAGESEPRISPGIARHKCARRFRAKFVCGHQPGLGRTNRRRTPIVRRTRRPSPGAPRICRGARRTAALRLLDGRGLCCRARADDGRIEILC